jgi:hypothetical protein
LDWQPFDWFDTIRIKNTETIMIDGRKISLAVSDVQLSPVASSKYPHGVMIIYLMVVLGLGSWIYHQFSQKIMVGAYGVFGSILVAIWWWGTNTLVFLGLTHVPFVGIAVGVIFNSIVLYYMWRWVPALQVWMNRGIERMTPWIERLRVRVLPVVRYGQWLWQRPIVLYTLSVVLYFCPWLWQQQVISPIDVRLAANLPVTEADYNTSSYFSDYVFYTAEEHMLMHAPRAGWLSTWSDMNQLGRPLSQLGGWNVSYVLTWVLRIWIDNPYVFFTVNFVLYTYLAGLFALLYVRQLLHHTGLALLAAYLIIASPFFFYWNTYLTFVATTCWALALLCGFLWLRNKPSWQPVLLLAFAVYSLLSMGYQQMIIHLGYIFVGYVVYLLWQLRDNRQRFWQFIGYAIGAMVMGIVMAVPVYLDTIQAATLATVRQTLSAEYFYDVMPYFNGVTELFRAGLNYVLKDIFVPVDDFNTQTYPYRGGYTSLFVCMLVLIGAIWRWRDTWGWSVWVVIAVLFSFSRTAFVFGYEQLHLPQLSRAVMFYGAGQQVPELILAVYGAHVLLHDAVTRTTKILLGAVWLGVTLIVSATMFMTVRDVDFQWIFMGSEFFVVFELVIVGCLLVMALIDAPRIKMAIMFGVLSIQLVWLLQPLLLTKSITAIATTSPSTEVIRQTLQPGERMAMVDELDSELANQRATYNELTPFGLNYNAVLNLPQLGTYYPLQSKYYVTLMKRFGVNYDYYNPYIRKIALPMPENDQWMANIRTIVSKNPLTDSNLTLTARTDGFIPFYVYTTPATMGCCLQVPLRDVRIVPSAQQDEYWIDTPKAPTNRQLQKSEDQGDRFVVPVTESTNENIIVFSQIYYAQWYARVRTATGWQDAPTVVVNAAYQGVLIPAGTQEVIMEFRPWAYWSIIPNIFWLGCLLVLFGRWVWMDTPFQSYMSYLRQRRIG